MVELIANPSIAIERAGSLGVSATARDLVLPPGEKVAYHWIWGDKSKSVTPTGRAAHTYTAPGTYQVAVYAVDAAGAVVATAESEVSIED